jgi:hypothetical protein
MKNGAFWVVTPCGSCKNREDNILHSHRRENLKSYTTFFIVTAVKFLNVLGTFLPTRLNFMSDSPAPQSGGQFLLQYYNSLTRDAV